MIRNGMIQIVSSFLDKFLPFLHQPPDLAGGGFIKAFLVLRVIPKINKIMS